MRRRRHARRCRPRPKRQDADLALPRGGPPDVVAAKHDPGPGATDHDPPVLERAVSQTEGRDDAEVRVHVVFRFVTPQDCGEAPRRTACCSFGTARIPGVRYAVARSRISDWIAGTRRRGDIHLDREHAGGQLSRRVIETPRRMFRSCFPCCSRFSLLKDGIQSLPEPGVLGASRHHRSGVTNPCSRPDIGARRLAEAAAAWSCIQLHVDSTGQQPSRPAHLASRSVQD